jgi:hypothetical protein
MDMEEYDDRRETTATSFKLECGHAFHTKCIIDVLSRTNHKCPSCNKHKSSQQVNPRLLELKKDERIKLTIAEYYDAKKEYKAKLGQLKRETIEWAKNRAQELLLTEHKSYYLRSKTAVISVSKQVATEKGRKYIAAFRGELDSYKKIVYGNSRTWGEWRLSHPRIWFGL